MEGDGVLPQLAPVRFIALHHGEDCPEPFVQPDLAGPDWLLVSLAGAPVEVSAEQRRPYLAFHVDGCASPASAAATGCSAASPHMTSGCASVRRRAP
jgi:hypothetical protein